jgi:hypothetical protein
MAPRVLTSAVAAMLSALPLPAAADQPRPLRTLTYAVDVTVVGRRQAPNEGPPPARASVLVKGREAGSSRVASPAGAGAARREASTATTGTITVDVVHVTEADAGLIIDVAEDAPQRSRPKVRIAVAADGTLYYDPANLDKLSEEEVVVAHWLGRAFYGDRPTEIGTSWTVDQSANGRTDVEHYSVLARDDTNVTLSYALEERTTDPRGYAGTRQGSLVYDKVMVVPVRASFEGVAHRQLGGALDTVRTSVKLTLTADTFAKR